MNTFIVAASILAVLTLSIALIVRMCLTYYSTQDDKELQARLAETAAELEFELADTAMKSKAVSELKDKIELKISTQDIATIFGKSED